MLHLSGHNLVVATTVAAYDASGNSSSDTLAVLCELGTVVNILTPTTEAGYTTNAPVIGISGTAWDDDGIARVTWSSACDPDWYAQGACTGTTNWYQDVVPLTPGSNLITVTAWDTLGNTAEDTLAVVYTPAGPAITNGLVLYYSFDADEGDVVTDESPSGYHGVVSGAAHVTNGISGGAYEFYGDEWISAGNVLDIGAEHPVLTACAWVRIPVSASGRAMWIVNKNQEPRPYTGWACLTYQDRAMADLIGHFPERTASMGTSIVVDDEWHFICGVFEARTDVMKTKLYVDGALEASNEVVGAHSPTETEAELWIGHRWPGTGPQGFTRLIDEVRIYDRALTDEEIGWLSGAAALPPSVEITGPTSEPSYVTNRSPITVSGTASSDAGVELVVWWNDRGGSGIADGTDMWSSDITLFQGTNVITVAAYDASGNSSSDTLAVLCELGTVVNILTPTTEAGYTTNAPVIGISGTAWDDDGIARVTWSSACDPDWYAQGACTGTTNWYQNVVPLLPGTNLITVTARDTLDNIAQDTLAVVYAPAGAEITNGLVLYYSFDEDEGGIVTDESPSGYHGTVSGATHVDDGVYGGAYEFYGNQWISAGNVLDIGAEHPVLTACAWVRIPVSASGRPMWIVNKNQEPWPYTGWACLTYQDRAMADLIGHYPERTASMGSSIVVDDEWHFICGVFEARTDVMKTKLYVDGALEDSSEVVGAHSPTETEAELWIGHRWPGTGPQGFTRLIDEVRIYDRELEEDEIERLSGYTPSPPAVEITGPAADPAYMTNASPITLSGTASSEIGVELVIWWNERGGSGVAEGTNEWSSDVALFEGTNTIIVAAFDSIGQMGTDTLVVTLDTTAPTVEITGPTSNDTWMAESDLLAISGTAWDNAGIAEVTWANDRGGSGACSLVPAGGGGADEWSRQDIALAWGVNIITVTAYDTAGNSSSDQLEVTMESLPVSGLKLWVKADAGVTADGNGLVSVWADQSGNANDFAQALISSRPELVGNALNGLPAVGFDGLDDYLTGLYTPSGEVTMIVMRRYNSFRETSGQAMINCHGSGGFFLGAQSASGPQDKLVLQTGLGGPWVDGVNHADAHTLTTNWAMDWMRISEQGTEFWIDDALMVYDVAHGSIAAGNPLTLGEDGAAPGISSCLDGEIAEVLVYDRMLSPNERVLVGDYLAQKYGREPGIVVDLEDVALLWQDRTTNIAVIVSPSPAGADIVLTLSRDGGASGSATFDDGNITKIITGTTNVTIRGVEAGDMLDNIRLAAAADGTERAAENFTVGKVEIEEIDVVPEGGTNTVRVTVMPELPDVNIALTLSRTSGDNSWGWATFADGSTTADITGSTNLAILGVEASSEPENMRLTAQVNEDTLATDDFTVVSVRIEPFDVVCESGTRPVHVMITPETLDREIALTLERTSGDAGAATFQDSGSETTVITESVLVMIVPIEASSANNNMRLFAEINGMECASEDFTVARVEFEQIGAVPLGGSRDMAMTVTPSPCSPIMLDLWPLRTGSATFDDDSVSREITGTTNVTIEGVSASDWQDDIVISAGIHEWEICSWEVFSVVDVRFDPLLFVREGATTNMVVQVYPSPFNAGVTLHLTNVTGTGSATFEDGETSKLITETTDLTIMGVTTSSVADNIRLYAVVDEIEFAEEYFTVAEVSFDEIDYICVDEDRNISVKISPPSLSTNIILTLERTTGTNGLATFADGSQTNVITGTTNVTIKGLEASSEAHNTVLNVGTNTYERIKITIAEMRIEGVVPAEFLMCQGTEREIEMEVAPSPLGTNVTLALINNIYVTPEGTTNYLARFGDDTSSEEISVSTNIVLKAENAGEQEIEIGVKVDIGPYGKPYVVLGGFHVCRVDYSGVSNMLEGAEAEIVATAIPSDIEIPLILSGPVTFGGGAGTVAILKGTNTYTLVAGNVPPCEDREAAITPDTEGYHCFTAPFKVNSAGVKVEIEPETASSYVGNTNNAGFGVTSGGGQGIEWSISPVLENGAGFATNATAEGTSILTNGTSVWVWAGGIYTNYTITAWPSDYPGGGCSASAMLEVVIKVELVLENGKGEIDTIVPFPENEDYEEEKEITGGYDQLGPLPMGQGNISFPGQVYVAPIMVIGTVSPSTMPSVQFRWRRWVRGRSWFIINDGTKWVVTQRLETGFPGVMGDYQDDFPDPRGNDPTPSEENSKIYVYDASGITLYGELAVGTTQVGDYIRQERDFIYTVDYSEDSGSTWNQCARMDIGQITIARRKDTTGSDDVAKDWEGFENSNEERILECEITVEEVREIVGGVLPIAIHSEANE